MARETDNQKKIFQIIKNNFNGKELALRFDSHIKIVHEHCPKIEKLILKRFLETFKGRFINDVIRQVTIQYIRDCVNKSIRMKVTKKENT